MVKDEEKLKFHWELLVSHARTEKTMCFGKIVRKPIDRRGYGGVIFVSSHFIFNGSRPYIPRYSSYLIPSDRSAMHNIRIAKILWTSHL